MFDSLGFETLKAPQAAVWLGIMLGLAFGVLAQITRFCFRRSLFGADRKQAMGIWLTALAVAVLGTQGAVAAGWISFANHRFLAAELPVLAIVIGGLMFGTGMVLTRGCASRLTVLAGSGNLRAALVLVVFAVIAHAALRGVLAPLRTTLGSVTLTLDNAALPGAPLLWAGLISVVALVIAWRSGNRVSMLVLAACLGALVPLGWIGTGFVLVDDFEPIAMESLSFTSAATDALFFLIASSAISPTFGAGLIGAVVVGALISSLIRREFMWESFHSPRETGRYIAGAALMGAGGVLAGGCTVGAGMSGVPTLSLAAILAIAAIAAGGLIANRLLNAGSSGRAAPATRPATSPAK